MANDELNLLEELSKTLSKIEEERNYVKEAIRKGFQKKTIVFMDVVGSSEFKVKYIDEPEIWILRVKQFSDILATTVTSCNGKVVKYIGDEVMASFENPNDAMNLVARVPEITDALTNGTGFETKIKVTVDIGFVYELNFKNHFVPDPQGSVVDRCARIAKYSIGGEVLSSECFAKETYMLKWEEVGTIELRGLGKQSIYQLNRKTVSLDEKIEVKKQEYEKLQRENAELKEAVNQLEKQAKEAGQKPTKTVPKKNNEWQSVKDAINVLKKIIDDAPVDPEYYARFIFLDHVDNAGEAYNKYEGKVFDELIEHGLVISDDSRYYFLNGKNRRNIKAKELLDAVDECLGIFLSTNKQDEDDLFDWTTFAPEFWHKYIGYRVS